jgi:hypothetical protein
MGLFFIFNKTKHVGAAVEAETTLKSTMPEKVAKAIGWYGGRAVDTYGPGVATAGSIAIGVRLATTVFGSGAIAAGAGSICGAAFAPVLVPTLVCLAAKIAGKSVEILAKTAMEECASRCKKNQAAPAA